MESIYENIGHLRDILTKYQLEDTTEAIEFLDAIESDAEDIFIEMGEKDQEIKNLETDSDEESDDPAYDNSDFVGLDTINWSLENGNLVIQQKMEYFVEALKKQNAVVPA